MDPKGAWRRRYRAKEAAVPALPGDYAALMWGVMELYESAAADKQKKDWLRYAENLAVKLEENFWDEPKGGFFLSLESEAHVFLRLKSASDDAAPSANAMAMMAYAALARAVPDNKKYADTAKAISSCFARRAIANPLEHISIYTASMKLKAVKGAKEERASDDEKDGEKDLVNNDEKPDFRLDRRR